MANYTSPIVEVTIGAHSALIDLKAVDGVQGGSTDHVMGLISGEWIRLGTREPDKLIETWRKIRLET